MSYHNTTHQQGETLETYQKKSDKQDERVLEIFKEKKCLSACQCWQIYEQRYGRALLTSIRRSISDNPNLKKNLDKSTMILGYYSRPVHVYQYTTELTLFKI